MKYLIVGLGNPGDDYLQTRHNIGFMVLDELARKHQVRFVSDRQGWTSTFKFKGRQVHLLKPSSYMNLSGGPVQYWLQQLRIGADKLLVVVDDLALPFGTLRIRGKGSSAGHNGLGNIQDVLGHTDWARLRLGIGNDFPKGHQADFVLSPFGKEEKNALPDVLDRAGNAVESYVFRGLQDTMNFFNQAH